MFNGSWFHSLGPATENARSPYDLVQIQLTAIKFCEIDRAESVRVEIL